MAHFFIRRILGIVLAMFFIISLTFFLMQGIPGGPFDQMKKLPVGIEKNINEKYHLDDPLFIQYQDYLWDALRFDFGPSFRYQSRTVNDIIKEGFPVSALLGFAALLIALLLGFLLGIISALNRNRFPDYCAMTIATLGFSVPGFVMGSILMYVFAYRLGWFPAAMWGTWQHLVLPAISLSLFPMAVITRLVKTGFLEVLQQDYIKTGKAKGLSKGRILCHHTLRNALTPLITYFGPLVATTLTGSFVIEQIFNIPGLGKYFVTGVLNRDYTLIMGTTVFFSWLLMLMNFIGDLFYVLIDPRVKLIEQKR
ncbi:MAG: ABC transporter permease [Dehalobacterium sp.]|jgi:oligopeptide transport system permease protein